MLSVAFPEPLAVNAILADPLLQGRMKPGPHNEQRLLLIDVTESVTFPEKPPRLFRFIATKTELPLDDSETLDGFAETAKSLTLTATLVD